jgi:hypothetical protein
MAQAGYKGKRFEVEILTDTYKIRGMLFVPLAGEGGYSSRPLRFPKQSRQAFSRVDSGQSRSVTGTGIEMGSAVPSCQQARGNDGAGD